MAEYAKSLFIFRRDLRVTDNTGLLEALKKSASVLPVFIFDERQIGAENEYRSAFALRFMIESLYDLEIQLKEVGGALYCFEGIAEQVVAKLIQQERVQAVFVNQDYTPFSKFRDEKIAVACKERGIVSHSYHDALLTSPQYVRTQKGTPYQVFTAFFKAASQIPVPVPVRFTSGVFVAGHIVGQVSIGSQEKSLALPDCREVYVHGGRKNAVRILASLSDFKEYDNERDIPSKNTTLLSAHHKFGTISIRESYHAIQRLLGSQHSLIKQLYWRDFFYHVAYHKPSVFGHAYHEQYEQMWWSTNDEHFAAWCTGRTGYPLVDAGMRQLNQTGFMHNRVRMVAASFLTKLLHINWLWGERYFAQHLADYDPCVNNGNWQWAASTGCDAQPYFRMFNPWLQQKKFDPECVYIKQWVPELRHATVSSIHALGSSRSLPIQGYPRPVVDYVSESRKTKELFAVRSSKRGNIGS